MLTDYRSNDAVLTICQNNKAEIVTITEVNDIAKELTGFSALELIGKPLANILPERIAELLTEYVDFENDTSDVGTVLSKVQSFSIIGKNGKEKAYRIKIVRVPSSGNILLFLLVLQDGLGARKNEAVRKVIRENFKGHEALDPQTELPNRASLIKDIGVMKRYSTTNDILSCLAVLQIDNYDKLLAQYGAVICLDILKYIGFLTKNSMRPDDVVASIGNDRIAILLVDMAKDSERLVLNRLRWQIASNPYIGENKNTIGLSVSISFCDIVSNIGDKETVEKCETALDGLSAGAHNVLVEATV